MDEVTAPPLTDTVWALVTEHPLEASALEEWASSARDGAVVTFRGVVRNHDHGSTVTGLEYQAHPDAERHLRETLERMQTSTGLRVAVAHRTGALEVGDLALVAVVAAPHRSEAFSAISTLINEIKQTVPIWKRQRLEGGATEWVGLP